MRKKPIRWLYDEIPDLLEKGVIDEFAAQALRDHYGQVQDRDPGRNILYMVFGVLGALLIGGGISLLLAHNWEDLGRPARASLTFALLLSTQALTAWVLWRRGSSAAWKEGAALFQGLAVVSAIALIGQTYNVAGDLEGLLFTSIVLIAPLIYLLQSRCATSMVWIASTWWLMEGFWRTPSLSKCGWYLVLAGCTIPFMIRLWKRHAHDGSTALVGWVAGGSILVAGIRLVADLGHGLWIPFYAGGLGCLYVTGLQISERSPAGNMAWRKPFHSLGSLGLAVMLFTLSFRDPWDGVSFGKEPETAQLILILIVALALCALPTVYGIRLLGRRRMHQGFLALVPAAVVLGWLLVFIPDVGDMYASLLGNIVALGVGLTVCVTGARDCRLGTANAGLLLVLAILAARFFDADLSFVTRGVVFILLGLGLLGTNIFIVHRRKEGAS